MEARNRKGISQDELAKHLGNEVVRDWPIQHDEMKPSIEVAEKMAEVLDVSLDYLGGKTDVLLNSKISNIK